LLEEISSSFSKAKLTESEAKSVSTTKGFGYFVSSLVYLSKEKLKKSKFPEFLLVCEKREEDYFQEIIGILKVEFSKINVDLQSSMEDIQSISCNPSGFKEEKFIE